MKKILLALIATLNVCACASFQPDYVVTDASEDGRPSWIKQSKAYKVDSSSEAKKNKYYVSDSLNINQRLCLKSAEARATQKIASEVAQEIMAKFSEETKSANDVANEKMKDSLKQNVQVNLHGVIVAEKYWEKRAYKKEMGAEKDYSSYKCDVVVKISKEMLQEALEMYKAKTIKDLTADEKKEMNAAVDAYIEQMHAE